MCNLFKAASLIWISLGLVVECVRVRIPIGVILEPGDDISLTVVKYGLWTLDQRRSWPKQYVLEIVKETVALDDATQLDRAVCRLLQQGVYAVIAPTNTLAYQMLVSYSNEYELPLVSLSFPEVPRDLTPRFAVSVQPSTTRAVLDLLRYYKWHDIVYMYDDSQGPEKLQQIFQLGYRVLEIKLLGILKATNPEQVNRYFQKMEMVKKHRTMHVILDTDPSLAKDIIVRHVHDIYVSKSNFHFILCRPVLEEFWVSHPPEFGAVNVTGFLALPIGSSTPFEDTWRHLSETEWPGAGTKLNVSSYLYHDAAFILGEGLRKLLQGTRYKPPSDDFSYKKERSRNCLDSASVPLPQGSLLGQYIKQGLNNDVLTGKAEFDAIGQRKNIEIPVMEVVGWDHRLAGIWSDAYGLKISGSHNTFSPIALPRKDEKKKRYRITTVLSPPFLMYRGDMNSSDKMGNERFEGYCKDFIDLLAKELNFEYELNLASDGSYGVYSRSKGEWTGMIGEIIRGKADMAVVDLHITPERLRVVDFAESYFTSSLSILMKNPQFVMVESSEFFFLDAFAGGVWICILAAAILVVALFHTMCLFTGAPDNIEAASGIWGKKFTLIGSTWFVLGSGMFQGTGIYPRSISSRILGAAWWCFTLALLALYIASTTTQLSMGSAEEHSPQLTSLSSLSLESIITESIKNNWPKIAIFKGGRLHQYVQQSSLPFLKDYEAYLNDHPELLVGRISEEVHNVRNSKGGYAVLMESSFGDFHSKQKPCDTVSVHDIMESFYSGIAVPLGSSLKDALNGAQERLQERGELSYLRQKWFLERSSCNVHITKSANRNFLGTLSNFSGILYVLLMGLAVTALLSVCQYFWKSQRRNERRQKLSFDEVAMGQSLPLPPPELLRDSPEFGSTEFEKRTHL